MAFHAEPGRELRGLCLLRVDFERGHQVALAKRIGGRRFLLRTEVLCLYGCHHAALREQLTAKVGAYIQQLDLRLPHLLFGLHCLDLQVGVAQFEQHIAGFHLLAGFRCQPLHPRARLRGDEADVLGHQRAGAAHFAHHVALAHAVDQYGVPLDGLRGRLQSKQPDGNRDHRRHAAGDQHIATGFLGGSSCNIHESVVQS
jgi:hypothetical protein